MRTRLFDFTLLTLMAAIGAMTISSVIAGGFDALIAQTMTAIGK